HAGDVRCARVRRGERALRPVGCGALHLTICWQWKMPSKSWSRKRCRFWRRARKTMKPGSGRTYWTLTTRQADRNGPPEPALRVDDAGSGEHQGGQCRNRLAGNAEPIAQIVVKRKPEFFAGLHQAEHRVTRRPSVAAHGAAGDLALGDEGAQV